MTIKDLQIKQQELDTFVIRHNLLSIGPTELLKNMILACHDEISEVEEAPDDIEEYIDVLHFVLSIANKSDMRLSESRLHQSFTMRQNLLQFTRLSRVFKHWSCKEPSTIDRIEMRECLCDIIDEIYSNCNRLGGNMFDEYEKKYKINIKRQEDGGY